MSDSSPLADRADLEPASHSTAAADSSPVSPDSNATFLNIRLQVALLLAISFAAYANSLFNGFTMDDELYILRNPQVTQHSARLLFQPNAASNVFRPVTFATFALNWLAAGYRPFGYHLVNLLLHAAVVVLLLFVLRCLLAGIADYELVCISAALLFAVHPVHTEAVSSVVGRSELLAAGFLLAAWLFHLRDRYVLVLVGFVLALASKESAIGLLPLVFAGDYARGKLKPWARYAGLAVVTLIYLGALWKIQGGHFGAADVSVLDNSLVLLPTHLRILNAIRIAWKYIALLIFPGTLSCDYSYNQIHLFADARHLLPALVAGLLVFAAWIWAIGKRNTAYIVAGAIYVFGFAATANILTRTGTIFGERLAYFPSAGFCLLAALACARLASRHRFAAIALVAPIAVALAARTVVRNRDWHDNGTLYTAAADAVPNSAKIRTFRGIILLGADQFDRSRSDLQTALSIYPEYPDAVEAMGLLEARSGNAPKALPIMRKAVEMSDRKDIDYDYRAVNLAALEIQIGELDDAMKLLNREIAESPGYSRAWSNRAVLHLKLGQLAEAREDARAALQIDAVNPQALKVLNRQPNAPLP